MPDGTVYDELGVPAVVNASGTKTRIGGSRTREEARETMDRAVESFVRLSDLQAAASDRVAEIIGAEASYVTNGAAGGLLLSAAACIAGEDPKVMSRLPDTDGVTAQGIGRPLKVGKEELVGLLRALELFVEEDHEATSAEWRERADRIAHMLSEIDAVTTDVDDSAKSVTPTVAVSVDEGVAPVTTAELVRALRREEPRVFVGVDTLDAAEFRVNPMCLTDDEADHVVERIRANLGCEAGGTGTICSREGGVDSEGDA